MRKHPNIIESAPPVDRTPRHACEVCGKAIMRIGVCLPCKASLVREALADEGRANGGMALMSAAYAALDAYEADGSAVNRAAFQSALDALAHAALEGPGYLALAWPRLVKRYRRASEKGAING